MSVCDICNIELKNGSTRFSSEDIKKAVKSGFRPPKSDIDDLAAKQFGPEGKKLMEAKWIENVMNDTSDWILCPKCSHNLKEALKNKKSWLDSLKSLFKQAEPVECQKCHRRVKLLGDQIQKEGVPTLTKDEVVGIGFYCSQCRKIFCGGCSLPSLLLNTPGTQMGLPKCPECDKRVDWASPSQA